MFRIHLIACFLASMLLCALPMTEAHAQLTITGIGADPVKKENYSCVRFTNKSQNNIEVTSQTDGKTKQISIKRAKRAIRKSLQKVKRRRTLTRRGLKRIDRQIRKLQSKLILTPKKRERLDKLKLRRENVEVKISVFTTEIASLKETAQGINACKKDELSTSGLQIVSGVVTDSGGRPIFYVGAHFPLDNWDSSQEVVCAKVNGRVRDFRARHPDSCLRTDPYDTKICLVSASSYFSGRYFVSAAGRSGNQKPGTCPWDPAMCSLAEALADVLAYVKDVKYEIVGTAKSARDCR